MLSQRTAGFGRPRAPEGRGLRAQLGSAPGAGPHTVDPGLLQGQREDGPQAGCWAPRGLRARGVGWDGGRHCPAPITAAHTASPTTPLPQWSSWNRLAFLFSSSYLNVCIFKRDFMSSL